MRKLYYNLYNDGFAIHDMNDEEFRIIYHDNGKDEPNYEKIAGEMIRTIKVPEYVKMFQDGIIDGIDIPAEYYDEVYNIINKVK